MSPYLEDRCSNFYSPYKDVRAGDVVLNWCHKHMTRTDHLCTGHSLICLECEPEKVAKDERED